MIGLKIGRFSHCWPNFGFKFGNFDLRKQKFWNALQCYCMENVSSVALKLLFRVVHNKQLKNDLTMDIVRDSSLEQA